MKCTTARNSVPDRPSPGLPRTARSHLPSTEQNQLRSGRRTSRQLLKIEQRNVRTLLDRESADRPERCTALVAMEFAKYNIDIAAHLKQGSQSKSKGKGSSYIAQYPILRTAQSALHFTSLTDLFTQTPSRLLWEASSHMLQLMREGCSYTYPSLSIARYSFIQLSELEQCRVKTLVQGFNTAAQDSNPGSRSR